MSADQPKPSTDSSELDKVASVVAYWLSSPINTLRSLSGMFLTDIKRITPEESEQFAIHLDTQVEKLQYQMRNLIAWGNLRTGNIHPKRQTVDVEKLLHKLDERYKPIADRKRVHLFTKAQPLKALADTEMLLLITQNLVENAVKFSRQGDEIHLTVQKEGNDIQLQITDTGIGMSAAKLEAIKDVGRKGQVGTAGEVGHGLGLVVARGLAEQMELALEITSERGKGTVATITLPAKKA